MPLIISTLNKPARPHLDLCLDILVKPCKGPRPSEVHGTLVMLRQAHRLLPLHSLRGLVHERVPLPGVHVELISATRLLEFLAKRLGILDGQRPCLSFCERRSISGWKAVSVSLASKEAIGVTNPEQAYPASGTLWLSSGNLVNCQQSDCWEVRMQSHRSALFPDSGSSLEGRKERTSQPRHR